LYKKQKKKRDEKEQKSDDKGKKKRPSKKGDSDIEEDTDDESLPPKYATIGLLTNATVVTEPPPAFARFMLRKSVDRLNSEFRVINEFRSRLEELQNKRNEEHAGHRLNSQGDIPEE